MRIIAASNSDLNRLSESGTFRPDLLYRLRVLHLTLPPLRERGDDVLLLAREFLQKCKREYGCRATELDEASCRWFNRYRWPGNVRELEAIVYREALLCDETILRLAPPAELSLDPCDRETRFTVLNDMPYTVAKSKVIENFTRQYLAAVLNESNGNVSRAAQVAGKERRAFGKLLKKHGVSTQRREQL